MRTHIRLFIIAGVLLPLGVASFRIASTGASISSSDIAKNSDPRTIVLGARLFAPDGEGFGTTQPREIFNGGDPSGHVSDLHWHNWGSATATATGETSIFKPNGGYYDHPVPAELRASKLGRCTKSGPLAYTKLEVREPSRPGGPLGKWSVWSDEKSICNFT